MDVQDQEWCDLLSLYFCIVYNETAMMSDVLTAWKDLRKISSYSGGNAGCILAIPGSTNVLKYVIHLP